MTVTDESSDPSDRPSAIGHSHPAVRALQGSLIGARAPLAYRFGLVIVTIAMVLLPVIYVGLIVAVAYALYLYPGVGLAFFGLVKGSGADHVVWRGLGFTTPLVVGIILIFFMIKPLFARRTTEMEPLALDRTRQRDLFDFVDRLCGIVGAPRPRRIAVDCTANASAAFDGGVRGLLSGHLVLTIGLPLVAGLDLRGLAGVLAHEFGHFAQGTGMRLSYVIRRVNHWFARVVYERDAWDEWLDECAKTADFRVGIPLQLSRGFVMVTRQVLWLLMMVGHGISCFMLRQMEFDADRYEARLSGARVFESTVLRINLLNVASAQAMDILGRLWDQRELPQDLPDMVVQLADVLPARVVDEVGEHIRSRKTRFFDTHPADKKRIARARRESAEGSFRLELPATTLFRDFEALSRNATLKFYRDVVGAAAEQAVLIPVAKVVEEISSLNDQVASLERVFSDTLRPDKLVWLPRQLEPMPDWQAACVAVRDAKRTMSDRLPAAKLGVGTLASEDNRRMRAVVAHSLMEAKVRIGPVPYGLVKADPAEARAAIANAEAALACVAPDIDAYLESAGEWLGAALRLLAHPQTAQKIESSLVERDMQPLVQAFRCLQAGHDDFMALREPLTVIPDLSRALEEGLGDPESHEAFRWMATQLKTTLEALRERLTEAYPFKHAGGPIRIGYQVVGEEIAAPNDLGSLYVQAATAAERYQQLYLRLLACLTHAAEQLERELGLDPATGPGV